MKNIFLLIIILFAINAKSQIVFEHDYPSASTFTYGLNQLMIINFEVSGERYVRINRTGKTIDIYNMNHTLTKTISIANFPIEIGDGTPGEILYLSQNLFNLDTCIEFIYIANANSPSQCLLQIYNENGNLLFSDSASVPIRNNVPLQQYPIYNTMEGTKMILSYKNGHAKVFSLPGHLSADIEGANKQMVQMQQSNMSLSNAYPNPSNNTTSIDYKLPNGISSGEIVFYNLQGEEVKRFKVDNTFSTLLISTADIAAGTYYYQLQTNGESSGGKTMVVVK